MPEDVQTLSKGSIRGKSGYIPSDSMIREEIDRAMIMQFNLLPVARRMILEEMPSVII
jgi:mRNA interferase MazF